jgi:hypothetical protein
MALGFTGARLLAAFYLISHLPQTVLAFSEGFTDTVQMYSFL